MAERLFVDLLFHSSRKYASWDPEVPVVAGDYGRITKGQRGWKFWKKTGIFLKEGNIYEEGFANKYDIPQPIENGEASAEDLICVTSKNASGVEFEGELGERKGSFAQCKSRAAYKFSSRKAALLAMGNVTTTIIDPPGTLRRLLDDPSLKGYVIVSEVHRCSSYARLLKEKGDSTSTIAIGLSVDSSEENIDTADAVAKWVHSFHGGNFKSNINQNGERKFYPLFKLVSLAGDDVSTKVRGELDEDPPLPDAEPPWLNKTFSNPGKDKPTFLIIF